MTTSPSNSLLSQAQHRLASRLYDGAIVIDATLGNGYDTVFLAQHVAPNGLVYGFDIQSAAILSTHTRLLQAGLREQCSLHMDSHADMASLIPLHHHGNIAAIMFNLGYLPGANKQIITQTETTLAALNAALTLMAPSGLITILAYPGHQGGDTETAAIEQWCATLDSHSFTFTMQCSNTPNAHAPKLIVIEKSALISN